MASIKFGGIIKGAWNETRVMLFQPFSLKKWLLIGLILIWAGQLGTSNININVPAKAKPDINLPAGKFQPPPIDLKDLTWENMKETISNNIERIAGFVRENIVVSSIAGFAILLLLFSIYLWIYLRAAFCFVLLEDCFKHDASIRVPYHRNKRLARSYFIWNILFTSLITAAIVWLVAKPVIPLLKEGALSSMAGWHAKEFFSHFLPAIKAIIAVALVALFISMCTYDFIIAIMFIKRISIWRAWILFIRLFFKNILWVLLYTILKILLLILSVFVGLAIMLLAILVIILCTGIIALIGYIVLLLVPADLKIMATIVLGAIGLPIFLVCGLGAVCMLSPIPLFFRWFSLNFLAGMGPDLNILGEEAIKKYNEEDPTKYAKPMFALSLGFILPILVFFMIGASAVLASPAIMAKLPKNIQPALLQATQEPQAEEAKEPVLPVTRAKKTTIIYLNNGGKLEGEIERETETWLTLRVAGGTITVQKTDIRDIKKIEPSLIPDKEKEE